MSINISPRELVAMQARVRSKRTLRDPRFRGRVAHTLNGLAACQCAAQRIGETTALPASSSTRSDVRSPTRTEVRSPTRTSTHAVTTGNRTSTSTDGGYNTTTTNNYFYDAARPMRSNAVRSNAVRSTTLRGYRIVTLRQGVRNGLSGLGAPTELALIPVSDKRAVANAIRLFQASAPRSGFGSTEQTSGAVSGAAAGAKVGSIIPGIGTVIGAVIGAVVGWLAGKSKPVRPSAAEMAQCKALMIEYMGYASQSPNAPLPMEWKQLLDLNWCYQAIYGAEIKLKDPRWFNPGFESGLRPIAIDIVQKIYETPVGATVNLGAISFKDPKGRTISFKGFSFVNPVFTNLKTFSQQYFEAIDLEYCKATASSGAGGCAAQRAHSEWKRLLYDLLAWAARTTLPNISEADLAAASVVAKDTGTAASSVVSAVEQIIGRNVVKGETAALLTGQTDTPGITTPIPNSNAPPTLPGVTPQSAADVTALITQLLAQGTQNATVTQTALDALASRGAPITPAVTDAVNKEVLAQAGGVSSTALLTGGGILAALFMLGRPAKRGARR